MKLSRQYIDIFSEGALTNLPSASIDVIEYGRGQLAALTYCSATSAREVHILRLRHSFERIGIAPQFRYSLANYDPYILKSNFVFTVNGLELNNVLV